MCMFYCYHLIIKRGSMVKKKFDYSGLLKYISLFFVSLILANAKLGVISPFLYAFYFALLYVGIDEKASALFVLSSSCFVSSTLESFFVDITVVAIGLINLYIHRLCKKKMFLITNFIAYIISLVTYIYYNYKDFKNLILYIILGLICLFVFIVVLQVLLLRKNCFKLTLDESICFLFALALLYENPQSLSDFPFIILYVIITNIMLPKQASN